MCKTLRFFFPKVVARHWHIARIIALIGATVAYHQVVARNWHIARIISAPATAWLSRKIVARHWNQTAVVAQVREIGPSDRHLARRSRPDVNATALALLRQRQRSNDRTMVKRLISP